MAEGSGLSGWLRRLRAQDLEEQLGRVLDRNAQLERDIVQLREGKTDWKNEARIQAARTANAESVIEVLESELDLKDALLEQAEGRLQVLNVGKESADPDNVLSPLQQGYIKELDRLLGVCERRQRRIKHLESVCARLIKRCREYRVKIKKLDDEANRLWRAYNSVLDKNRELSRLAFPGKSYVLNKVGRIPAGDHVMLGPSPVSGPERVCGPNEGCGCGGGCC